MQFENCVHEQQKLTEGTFVSTFFTREELIECRTEGVWASFVSVLHDPCCF